MPQRSRILACATILASGGAASAQQTIGVGLQSGGTLSWVTFAILRYGIGRQLGFILNLPTAGA